MKKMKIWLIVIMSMLLFNISIIGQNHTRADSTFTNSMNLTVDVTAKPMALKIHNMLEPFDVDIVNRLISSIELNNFIKNDFYQSLQPLLMQKNEFANQVLHQGITDFDLTKESILKMITINHYILLFCYGLIFCWIVYQMYRANLKIYENAPHKLNFTWAFVAAFNIVLATVIILGLFKPILSSIFNEGYYLLEFIISNT